MANAAQGDLVAAFTASLVRSWPVVAQKPTRGSSGALLSASTASLDTVAAPIRLRVFEPLRDGPLGELRFKSFEQLWATNSEPFLSRLIRFGYRSTPVFSESTRPLQDSIRYGCFLNRWVRLQATGEVLPVEDFSYSSSPNQLGQMSLLLDGDQRGLFASPPVNIEMLASVAPVGGGEPFTYTEAVMQVWRSGGLESNSGGGSLTRIEARSLGAELLNNLNLTFRATGAGTLLPQDGSARILPNTLNDFVDYLLEVSGFGGGLYSELPEERLGNVVMLNRSAWSVITELAFVWGCTAAVDDRFGLLRITRIIERPVELALDLTGVGESQTEDASTGSFYNSVIVQGASQLTEADTLKILRRRRVRNERVDSPDAAQARVDRISTTITTRYLLGRTPLRTEEQRSVIYQDAPLALYNEFFNQREDWTYNESGQEVLYTLTSETTGPFQVTYPPVNALIGAVLWSTVPGESDHWEAVSFTPEGKYRYWPPEELRSATASDAVYVEELSFNPPALVMEIDIGFCVALTISLPASSFVVDIAVSQDP